MFTRRDWLKTATASPVALSLPFLADAAPPEADIKAVVDRAVKYLTGTQQEGGNFSAYPRGGEPGLTALIAAALVRNGIPPDNALVARALKYLEGQVKKDGGVYDQGLSTYMTSLAIMGAVARLGSALGIPTTAEGVETDDQLQIVRAEGYTEMQGFLISPPRPAGEIAPRFRAPATQSGANEGSGPMPRIKDASSAA